MSNAPTSPFAVGEIAIYWRPGTSWHNREVEIAGPLIYGPVIDSESMQRLNAWYHRINAQSTVLIEGASHWGATLRYLRKRPGHEVGSWDAEDAVFKPKGLSVKKNLTSST